MSTRFSASVQPDSFAGGWVADNYYGITSNAVFDGYGGNGNYCGTRAGFIMAESADSRIEPAYVIFCEDVRREDNGKDIIIGVFTDNIIVPLLPTFMRLAFWVPCRVLRPGNVSLQFRLSSANGDILLMTPQVSAEARTGKYLIIRLPGIFVSLNHPGTYSLELRQGDGKWETAGTIDLAVGAVPGAPS
jgi:hypothetical protein